MHCNAACLAKVEYLTRLGAGLNEYLLDSKLYRLAHEADSLRTAPPVRKGSTGS